MNQYVSNTDVNSLLANAPGNPVVWQRFLAELMQQLNCDSSALLITNLVNLEDTKFLFSENISPAYQEQYQNGLNKLDSFNYFISNNPKHIFCNQRFEDSYFADNYFEEIKSNFVPPLEQKYRFGVSIPCNRSHALNLLLNSKEAFSDEQQQDIIRTLETIIPALEEAMHGEQRYKINSQLPHYISDHYDGYIIVDHQLNILFSDSLYTPILDQLECMQISENQIQIQNPALKQQLFSLIENSNKQVSSIYNQCQSCQITLITINTLENLYQWEYYKDGFILAFTHDKAKNPSINRLTEIHQLSRCEAICALHFMKTPSISDVANNTFRSQDTVRNHIKHVMQKMDVHSQAELMKKLITLAAL